MELTHKGRRFTVESKVIDGEVAVRVRNAKGKVVYLSQECASAKAQAEWFFQQLDMEEQRPTWYPTTHDPVIAALYARLTHLQVARRGLYDDPMPCPCLGDFAEDFDRKERGILAALARRARQVGDRDALQVANGGLERWMP